MVKNLHLKKLDPSRCLIDPSLRWIYDGVMPAIASAGEAKVQKLFVRISSFYSLVASSYLLLLSL